MKRLFGILGIVVGLSAAAQAEDPKTVALTVRVDGLRNSEGVLQFSLYNKAGSIPDETFKKYYKQSIAEIKGKASWVTFEDLPAGTYAVSILHDENRDKKIDKGFVLPTEGVGFSNYKSVGLMNRPNFKDASFEVSADKKVSVSIIYF